MKRERIKTKIKDFWKKHNGTIIGIGIGGTILVMRFIAAASKAKRYDFTDLNIPDIAGVKFKEFYKNKKGDVFAMGTMDHPEALIPISDSIIENYNSSEIDGKKPISFLTAVGQ